MYTLNDYDYALPDDLIAQAPAGSRDQSRLMVVDRRRRHWSHHVFADLTTFLSSGDVLVINDTQVVPARLTGCKETGGRAEVLLLSYPGGAGRSAAGGTVTCDCLVRASKAPRVGSKIFFDDNFQARVLAGGRGRYGLEFQFEGDFGAHLERIGHTPLPPYIRRDEKNAAPCDDRACYQTVYAKNRGAVAAPTAGLHFSERVLKKIAEKGVQIVPLTLHVGYGTFLPVRATDIRTHRMHPEDYEFTEAAARAINEARDDGRRIIAVGTTTVRVLEFASNGNGCVVPGSGRCDLFIFPGFNYRVVDALITNFHLPKSTLLMLVSAFAGRDLILQSYGQAICERYRFYSYGDAMLIL